MKKKLLISLILIVLCCNFTMYSLATSLSDLEQQKNEAGDKKEELEDKKQEVTSQKKTALAKIDELNTQISESEDKISELKNKVKQLEADIATKESEIKQAEEKQAKQEETLEKRLIAQYKTGTVSYWSILLNPSSFLEFFSNLHNLERIAKIDSELIESIKTEKENLQKAKDELANQKIEVKTAKAEAEKESVKLKNAKIIKNSEVAKLTQEEKDIQAEIDEYEAEEKRIAALIREYNAQNNDVYTGGQLNWPVPSSRRITSPYGYRIHPLTGTSKMHKGIDIGAGNGAQIVAAESGTVIKVVTGCTHNYGKSRSCGCGGGYGNYLIISHGSGLATIYAHCASITVSTGTKVTRGQTIATVGSTGSSTGFHCHFEIQVNGVVKNPSTYL